MRKFTLTAFSLGLFLFAISQKPTWQQQVNYSITVALNDKEHTLDGMAELDYINHSPDTLSFIWFHVWPNAYKNDKTAYTRQSLENGSTAFYFSEKEDRGYINRLDFKVNGTTAELQDHPQHIDIVKLMLPEPLFPGKKIKITTPFHVKLPYNFSRGGHDGQSYQVTQWYPKPAVYDHKGWHPLPYLDQGEFYSEFGNYEVSITLPENYAVAATGSLQNPEEKEWLKSRSAFTWEPLKEKVKSKSGQIQTITQEFPLSSPKNKTIRFVQQDVHDFAWFADKRFIVNHDTCRLSTGKIIDVFSYYTEPHKETWSSSIRIIKETLRTRSEWVGDYPYATVSAVQGPESFGGGMEYPTITVLSPIANDRLFEFTLAHEVSHNWFYGILGSHERMHPWMDEGINTYYDFRQQEWKYAEDGMFAMGSKSLSLKNVMRLLFETKAASRKDQPISTSSEQFSNINYDLIAYYKAGVWLEALEKKLGKQHFDNAMQAYYNAWKFRHPYPEDFKKILEESSGQNLDDHFALLDQIGSIPSGDVYGSSLVSLFSGQSMVEYINYPNPKKIFVAPLVGANSYDKLMPGLYFGNYKIPANRFQFFGAAFYGTGSKQWNGMGRASHSFFPEKTFHRIDAFMTFSKFSMDDFTSTENVKYVAGFQKWASGIRFTLKEKDPRSQLNRFIQWKSFFFNEESFRIRFDTSISAGDTSIRQVANTLSNNRTLQQLRLHIDNYRALYPYSADLIAEHATDFIRLAFTGNYFFNYPKEGGLNLRLFAGKFFYLDDKTLSKHFATNRFHLNMTGANGYEDYTYSDYFIGRNRFNSLPSQQIMVRDGGFKVRTDLLADKVGRSDDWLAAINLTTNIPSAINPLSVFPLKIPLKLFADIGTYGEAWEKNADLDRFIFDAGIQLSLFSNTVNIYVPVLYSNVFKDYIQSVYEKRKRIWKTISFSIDISNFNLKKVNRELDF